MGSRVAREHFNYLNLKRTVRLCHFDPTADQEAVCEADGNRSDAAPVLIDQAQGAALSQVFRVLLRALIQGQTRCGVVIPMKLRYSTLSLRLSAQPLNCTTSQ